MTNYFQYDLWNFTAIVISATEVGICSIQSFSTDACDFGLNIDREFIQGLVFSGM
ncbi:MAG: hypothetical protein GY820_47120 [Gammaproteobacteria bacterium]|nr:hypothetical protein [Gammaproteobacteria bacterium]